MRERKHNPPRVYLDRLTPEERKMVILLALEVVADLASGNDWAAYEKIEFANMEIEVKVAFWSLLNSKQRSTIVSMREADREVEFPTVKEEDV